MVYIDYMIELYIVQKSETAEEIKSKYIQKIFNNLWI